MRISALLLVGVALYAACTYTIKIKDGATAWRQKQYDSAIPMLKKEITKAKSRTEKGKLAFLLGDAYRKTGRDEQSVEWFETAFNNNYGPDALRAKAYALKKTADYAAARETFKNLGVEIGSSYEYRREIAACTTAEGWIKEAPDNGYTVTAAAFNSPQNDFAPVLFADDRIVFTSDRHISKEQGVYAWTGNAFMDLFIVGQEEASAQRFDEVLSTKSNEGTACFNKTGTEIYFVRATGAYKGDDAYCRIYTATKLNPDGGWSSPEPLPFQKEKINYLHPALSPDGQTLYYACNDPEGWGGYDLYSVVRNPRTESGWEVPGLLSRNINTTANEAFPCFDADTLYFSSDGLTGMGGLDIFRTFKLDKNNWAPPINLKAPVNSSSDDFGWLITQRPVHPAGQALPVGTLVQAGFFTSNRPGGRGYDDIYRFEQRIPPPKPVPIVPRDTARIKPPVYKMVLELYVLEKIFSTPDDPNSAVLGRRPLAGATVTTESNGKKQTFTVQADGLLRMDLAEQTDYSFKATSEGYLTNSTRFSTKGIAKDPAQPIQVFETEIVLDKMFRNREIVLQNIYYDYDKWDIRPDAEPTLNKLADVLRQNPAIQIQLGSQS
jgi:tetratricopeptide (TPR) repeat protein